MNLLWHPGGNILIGYLFALFYRPQWVALAESTIPTSKFDSKDAELPRNKLWGLGSLGST